MKTYVHLWYIAELFLEKEMLRHRFLQVETNFCEENDKPNPPDTFFFELGITTLDASRSFQAKTYAASRTYRKNPLQY
jgi:hypothetical protein